MKKVKIGLLFLVAGFLALVVYQNQEMFIKVGAINLNLYFKNFEPLVILSPIYIYLVCAFVGFLISFFPSLVNKFRVKKQIKELNSVIDEKNTQIDELRNSISGMNTQDSQEEDNFSEAVEASVDAPETDKVIVPEKDAEQPA